MRHDGKRYSELKDALVQELSSSTPANLKWPCILKKYGIKEDALPAAEKLKCLELFSAEKQTAIKTIERAFTDHNMPARTAHRYLQEPLTKAVESVRVAVQPAPTKAEPKKKYACRDSLERQPNADSMGKAS